MNPVPSHMLAWLSFDEFVRLVIAHEDVRAMCTEPTEPEVDVEATRPTEFA